MEEELKTAQEKLRDKEREIRIINENFNQRMESIQIAKIEDIKKIQGVVNEQAELIASYEKILESGKNSSDDKIMALTEQINRDKDEIFTLTAKNNYLNTKLEECQEELSHFQKEIKTILSTEEEKRRGLQDKINELEKENRLKEVGSQIYECENKRIFFERKISRAIKKKTINLNQRFARVK